MTPRSTASLPPSAPPSRPTLKLDSLGLLVRRVRDGLIGQVESALQADGIDLTHIQFRAVAWLGKHHCCSASELARALEHDPGAMTRVLDRLVEKGLALREPQPGDRRVLKLRLTPAGEVLWAQVHAHFERVSALAVRGLDAAERRQLTDLLSRVAESLETPTEPGR